MLALVRVHLHPCQGFARITCERCVRQNSFCCHEPRLIDPCLRANPHLCANSSVSVSATTNKCHLHSRTSRSEVEWSGVEPYSARQTTGAPIDSKPPGESPTGRSQGRSYCLSASVPKQQAVVLKLIVIQRQRRMCRQTCQKGHGRHRAAGQTPLLDPAATYTKTIV